MAIDPITNAQGFSAAQNAQARLTGDLQSFLKLLTTQLQYQDPLEPVSATEFTAQLAQFANVEQGIQTNANLEKLIALSMANQAMTAVSYLGKYVEALSDTMALKNGEATFGYALPQAAEGVAIVIKNEAGQTVRTLSGSTGAGKHTVTWDGRDGNGLTLPDGKYKFSVSAVDKDGQPIEAQTYTVGIAESAEGAGGEVRITIDGVSVSLFSVVTVKASPPGA